MLAGVSDKAVGLVSSQSDIIIEPFSLLQEIGIKCHIKMAAFYGFGRLIRHLAVQSVG